MLRPAYVTITGTDDSEIHHSNIRVEKLQCQDEGRTFSRVEAEYEALKSDLQADDPLEHQEAVHEFLDRTQELPLREDFEYEEPNGLEAIKTARPVGPRRVQVDLDDDELYDRLYGAWLGRCAGCLLGKPTEGWSSDRMWGYLRDLDRYPLDDYFERDVDEAVRERYDLDERNGFVDDVEHMVRDDDIDYTVMGLDIVKEHGLAFDSDDVAMYWLNTIPGCMTYTAERVAYRNFLNLVSPPESARVRNPYREGIGAQIRADFYGYVSLGDPEQAAALAWRDARISHVKNGVYGSMWVAAMLAAAPAAEDPREVIVTGLSEVPAESRLADAVGDVIEWYESGVGYDEAVSCIHDRWDEDIDRIYDWLHTISNAQVVTVGLLYGEGDYEQSITRAVQACFDTDCNGATVGSVVGMMLGAEALPEKWVGPLDDRVETSLSGYPLERISDLARQTADLYREHTA
jgi:ADP-ribosylglycohydrolase